MNTIHVDFEHTDGSASGYPPKPNAFRMCLLIDGEKFYPQHMVDLAALVRSTRETGEFDIMTCGCGMAGCVGIYDAMKVRHEGDEIVWDVPDPLSYEETEDIPDDGDVVYKTYRFERNGYMDAVRDGLQRMQSMVRDGREDLCIGPYGFEKDDLLSLTL